MKGLFQLKNKVAIVTGGANGIGKAVVEVFCAQGAIVHILDVDVSQGHIIRELLNKDGKIVHFHHCDVSDHKAVSQTFQKIFDQHKSLDILVNNAGVSSIGAVVDTTPQEMDRIYQLNVRSVYSCLHYGVQHMKMSGGGAIVNMASIASVIGLEDRFAYSASKGAVYTMTYSVAKDYLQNNIRCNAVGPGRVHTPFVDGYLAKNYPGQEQKMFEHLSKSQPIGRMGQPVEIAHLITYLCSDEASFVTGSFYPIDGGSITLNS